MGSIKSKIEKAKAQKASRKKTNSDRHFDKVMYNRIRSLPKKKKCEHLVEEFAATGNVKITHLTKEENAKRNAEEGNQQERPFQG